VNFLRALDPYLPFPALGNGTNTYLRRTRWRGARILPCVNDFLLFAATTEEALTLRQRLASLLDRLGSLRYPTKGFRTPSRVGHHLEVDIDKESSYFYAPESKPAKIAQQAKHLIGTHARYPLRNFNHWRAQYLFLAIRAT
jgi:hypothetical protein